MNAVLAQYDFIVEGIEHYVRQAVKPPTNEPVHLPFKSASTPTTPVYPAMGRGLLSKSKNKSVFLCMAWQLLFFILPPQTAYCHARVYK